METVLLLVGCGVPRLASPRLASPWFVAASGRGRCAASGRGRCAASGRGRCATSGRGRCAASGRGRCAASGRGRCAAWGGRCLWGGRRHGLRGRERDVGCHLFATCMQIDSDGPSREAPLFSCAICVTRVPWGGRGAEVNDAKKTFENRLVSCPFAIDERRHPTCSGHGRYGARSTRAAGRPIVRSGSMTANLSGGGASAKPRKTMQTSTTAQKITDREPKFLVDEIPRAVVANATQRREDTFSAPSFDGGRCY